MFERDVISPIPKPVKINRAAKPLRRARFRAKEVDPLWLKTREEWFEENPPDLGGEYYQCALCPYGVHKDETTLDHIEPRSTHPHLKYVKTNLQPAHTTCNARKGSMSMEWYWDAYPLGEFAFPVN